MPKIKSATSKSSSHLHRIRSVGVTILNSHKQLNWSQRTRSNRSKCRLEIFYFALGELETVVKQWRQLVNLEDDKINKEEESSKQFFLTSFEKDVGFVDNFLIDIAVFREILLEAFLKPLIDAVSLYSLPTEIVLKIWHLTQPNLTLPVVWVNLVEARKFLDLLKTTTLQCYFAALKGKVVGSISLKQLLRLCHKNFNCIDGIQVPQSDCLQSSPADDGLWLSQPRIKTAPIFARLEGQNEAGGQS